MFEAYAAVYAPQELSEEQVWEEVENWANSLVDAGYDLSEHTWDDTYNLFNYIKENQLSEAIPALLAAPAGMAALTGLVGGAAKLWQGLQRQGKSKTQEPVDYGQGTYSSSSNDNPAPKPSWQKPSTAPSGSTTRLPSPAKPPAQPPTPKPPAQPPTPKPPAQPPTPKPPKPAASLGLRKGLGKAVKGVASAASAVGRAATSGPGKTALKYGVGVPVVGGLATGAAVDVKRAATGQSSATQRLSGALQGGAGNVLKTTANIGAAIPGVKDTGTPQEVQQIGQSLKKAGKDTQKKVDVKRYVELNQSADLLDIVKNYLIDNKYSNDEESALSIIENMSDEWIENILEAPELGSINAQGQFYTGPKYGYQSWKTASSKRLLPSEVLGSEPPEKPAAKPAPKPEPQRGSINTQGKFYTGKQYGYQSWKTASSKRLLPSEVLGSEPPEKPAPKLQTQPAAAKQAPTKPDPKTPPTPPAATPKPTATKATPTSTAAVPFGKTMPAPASASLDKLKINKDWAAANPRLAQAEVKKAEQRAAGKSTFSPEFRKTTTNPILYKPGALKQEATMNKEPYDLVLEYLFSQGHVDTIDEANYVMLQMDAEHIQNIVEDGFNSSGRYDVGGGRTVGPVTGAIRSLVTGNLPKSKTYVPPSKQTTTNSPPATPASKGDSGKLTDFGAGGGKAKLKQGMTVGQVERQGRMNKGDYSG
jgi:hypothetical protein